MVWNVYSARGGNIDSTVIFGHAYEQRLSIRMWASVLCVTLTLCLRTQCVANYAHKQHTLTDMVNSIWMYEQCTCDGYWQRAQRLSMHSRMTNRQRRAKNKNWKQNAWISFWLPRLPTCTMNWHFLCVECMTANQQQTPVLEDQWHTPLAVWPRPHISSRTMRLSYQSTQ